MRREMVQVRYGTATVRYGAAQRRYGTVRHSDGTYGTERHSNGTVQRWTVRHSDGTVRYGTERRYGTVRYGTAAGRDGTVRYRDGEGVWFILRRTSLPYSASLSSFLRFLLALDSIAIASAAAGPRAVQRERYSSSSESEVMASCERYLPRR